MIKLLCLLVVSLWLLSSKSWVYWGSLLSALLFIMLMAVLTVDAKHVILIMETWYANVVWGVCWEGDAKNIPIGRGQWDGKIRGWMLLHLNVWSLCMEMKQLLQIQMPVVYVVKFWSRTLSVCSSWSGFIAVVWIFLMELFLCHTFVCNRAWEMVLWLKL